MEVEKIKRRLTEDETAAVRDLFFQLAGHDIQVPSVPMSGSELFLAKSEGRVAGMITLSCYDAVSGRKGWIEDFVVDSAHNGEGIGRALMDAAIESARSLGLDNVTLTSVPRRVRAHEFYRAYGFCQRETDVFRLDIK